MSDRQFVSSVIEALKQSLPKEKSFIPLHEPIFQGNEWVYVKDCIDTGWVSSVGQYVNKFESLLAEYTGVKYAVATMNGTAALHISLLLVGVQVQDEVLIPSITFVATANAVSYCGAIPHFVDCESSTLGMDAQKLADYLQRTTEMRADGCYNRITGRRIRAVVPMHTFGHPVDLELLQEVCDTFRLKLIEDAAESLGSFYKGKHTGHWGKVSALSFNGNKVITTGGGGAILTNDEQLAKRAKHITTTAKQPHPWEFQHDEIAYNYRLPNINAALGCAQLERLPELLEHKRALVGTYQKSLEGIKGVTLFTEPEHARSNYWLQTLMLERPDMNLRNLLLEETNKAGIMTRPVWTPMHLLPMYTHCPRMDLTMTEYLQISLINIPSSSNLGGTVDA